MDNQDGCLKQLFYAVLGFVIVSAATTGGVYMLIYVFESPYVVRAFSPLERVFTNVLSTFVSWGSVALIYSVAKVVASKTGTTDSQQSKFASMLATIKPYLICIIVVTFISFGAWSRYGTHIEDADPKYGGGDVVVDFEPTDKERNEHGLTVFFTMLVPALMGVYAGRKEAAEAD